MVRKLWNRFRAWITEGYLRDLRTEMQGRLDAGDLDFDDVIYRQRDAAATLLYIRGAAD
jgi:hypothetical protein